MPTPSAGPGRQSRRDRRRKAALERRLTGGRTDDGRLHAEWMPGGALRIMASAGPATVWVELSPERATEVAQYILSGLPAANSPGRPI